MLFVTHQEVALSNKGLFSEKPVNDQRFLAGLDLPGSLASSLLTWIVIWMNEPARQQANSRLRSEGSKEIKQVTSR